MHITLKEFWDWVKRTFSPSYQTEVEQHLQDCVDIFELEYKMKELMKRGMI